MKNYIFGYGSLIERESRLRTVPNAQIALPAVAQNFQRGWFARMPKTLASISPTYLGCYPKVGSSTNGVIYEVTDAELIATDKREKGYERVKVDQVNEYYKITQPEDTIWIYINLFKFNAPPPEVFPSKQFPIVQSYVDICINGCIEIENSFPKACRDNFIENFIQQTSEWNSFWANDRIYPRRPFMYRKNAFAIDKILNENLPQYYSDIYIE